MFSVGHSGEREHQPGLDVPILANQRHSQGTTKKRARLLRVKSRPVNETVEKILRNIGEIQWSKCRLMGGC